MSTSDNIRNLLDLQDPNIIFKGNCVHACFTLSSNLLKHIPKQYIKKQTPSLHKRH